MHATDLWATDARKIWGKSRMRATYIPSKYGANPGMRQIPDARNLHAGNPLNPFPGTKQICGNPSLLQEFR